MTYVITALFCALWLACLCVAVGSLLDRRCPTEREAEEAHQDAVDRRWVRRVWRVGR